MLVDALRIRYTMSIVFRYNGLVCVCFVILFYETILLSIGICNYSPFRHFSFVKKEKIYYRKVRKILKQKLSKKTSTVYYNKKVGRSLS